MCPRRPCPVPPCRRVAGRGPGQKSAASRRHGPQAPARAVLRAVAPRALSGPGAAGARPVAGPAGSLRARHLARGSREHASGLEGTRAWGRAPPQMRSWRPSLPASVQAAEPVGHAPQSSRPCRAGGSPASRAPGGSAPRAASRPGSGRGAPRACRASPGRSGAGPAAALPARSLVTGSFRTMPPAAVLQERWCPPQTAWPSPAWRAGQRTIGAGARLRPAAASRQCARLAPL
mmetsp:Transcript_9116/g.26932  ORF Transcript_9116/g.26932 Transcript_9116/m.26932 type:complete len:233 (+) Transcript_9116:917-1615(+)